MKILLLMLFMCTVMTEIMAGTLLLWKKQQDTEEQRLYQNLEKMVTKRPSIKILEKPELLSYTPNADDVVLKSNIMYHYQCSEKMADEILKELEEKEKTT